MKFNKCANCGKKCGLGALHCISCSNKINPRHKIPHTKETKEKISKILKEKGYTAWNKGKKMNKPPHNKLPTKIVYCKCCGLAFEVNINSDAKYYKGHYQKILKTKNNPVKKKEVKDKIRKSLLQTYKNHPEILENRKPCGINQYSNSYTSIEKKIRDVLSSLKIYFIHNYKIGRFFVDFLIFENVIIECDGNYWHKDKDKDYRRDQYLMDRGYYIFRLSEDRINKEPYKCIKSTVEILKYLEHKETNYYEQE